jgi:hypothetical protein
VELNIHTTPANQVSGKARNSAGFLAIFGLPLCDARSLYINTPHSASQRRTETSTSVECMYLGEN